MVHELAQHERMSNQWPGLLTGNALREPAGG